MSHPRLSVLIPAYCYAPGLERILKAFEEDCLNDCELLIFDDSPDNEIEGLVSSFAVRSKCALKYQHNKPPLGAVANWNALLDEAQGEYCLLLHHDEFPLSENFVHNLVQVLLQDVKADILLLDCVLAAPDSGSCRRHLPMWLRTFVVRHCPNYLFRRNVVGPTATLVIRRSLYPRFDGSLRWLVDVDLYARVLKVTKLLRPCPHIQIGSLLGRADSITASLGSEIAGIERNERVYLQDQHPTARVWLGPRVGEPVFYGIMRVCEAACWYGMRLVTRIAAFFYPNPVSSAEVRHALNASPRA